MDYKYSQKLRDWLIAYFAKKYNQTISQEKADEYLDFMADLYKLFSRLN